MEDSSILLRVEAPPPQYIASLSFVKLSGKVAADTFVVLYTLKIIWTRSLLFKRAEHLRFCTFVRTYFESILCGMQILQACLCQGASHIAS